MEEDNSLDYYETLPRSVILGKKEYAVKTDYRIFINFEMQMATIDQKQAVNNALNQFYWGANDDIERRGLFIEAVNAFIWFYKCGQLEDYQEGRTIKKAKKVSQIFNYKYDAQLICGAYAILGYDLHEPYMHWWKFKELWNSFPEDCEFARIKSYRAYDGDDKDRIELREYYKLPPTMAEIKDSLRRKEIFNQLK